MAKKLLPADQAIRKITLSLILHGKSFKAQYLTCQNCKFYKFNTENVPQNWKCAKYKTTPYHSFLLFNLYEINKKDGCKRKVSRWQVFYKNFKENPECDYQLVLEKPRSNWQFGICRRFESN